MTMHINKEKRSRKPKDWKQVVARTRRTDPLKGCMETIPMSVIIKHIKKSDLPSFLTEKLEIDPGATLKITIEVEELEEDMPPEEMISDELIESVRLSEEDVKAGRTKRFKNAEEMFEDIFSK